MALFQRFNLVGRLRKTSERYSNPFLYLGVGLVLLLVWVSCLVPVRVNIRISGSISAQNQNLYVKSSRAVLRPLTFRVQGLAIQGNYIPGSIKLQTLGALSESEPEPDRDQITEYVVSEGDSLWSIADKFSVSLNTLLWANDLTKDSTLQPGQKLTILPVSGVLYVAEKGDTLSEIAQVYDADLEEIVSFNHLKNKDDIFPGDLLIIPGGEKPAHITPTKTPLAESYFIFPCQGTITQGPHGYLGRAVDIASDCWSPVVAAAGGEVQRAGSIRIGGKRVTILHSNGVVTYYGHLAAIRVKPGQQLKAGDIIGYIGNTGYTLGPTGCHVHFAVRGATNFLGKYPVGAALSWE